MRVIDTTWERMSRRIATGALALATLLVALTSSDRVAAHPHVWVEIDSELIAEGGRLTAVRHRWTFDEGYSEQAVEGLDTNKDGVIDRQELSELAKINMEALPQFGFFTEISAKGQRAGVKTPTDYWLEQIKLPPLKDDTEKRPRKVLVLHFILPLEQPLTLTPSGITFAVRDPSFFIAFLAPETTAVRVSGSTTNPCQITPDTDDERSLSDLAQDMLDAVTKAGEQPAAAQPDATAPPRFNQVYTVKCP